MKKSLKKKADTLEEFLARVEEFNSCLEQLGSNVAELRQVQARVLEEPSNSERQKHFAKHLSLVKDNKLLGRSLQKQIKEEKAKVEKLNKEENNSEVQIRKTQTQSCSKRFLDIWTEYNNAQLEFRDLNKKALIRKIKILDPNSNVTDEQLEAQIEDGDTTVIASIIKETSQAKDDLKQLEGRHAEMVKLEKGITEIHDMFIDLSNMVMEQGESVDRIGRGVEEAAGQVEAGRQQLQEARKKQKSARRKKFILAAIIAGVSLIVLLIIIFSFI